MDFSKIDIHAFLKASLPHRFQDINPYDFEKFMAVVFRADGYDVQETEYSGDYGADLILTKDGTITAVQVKRYAPGTLVSVGDVNQVIGACSYYKTDNALVVTTSDFTSPAITLAKSADVFLWNWQRLEKYISTVFLQGEDYHAYFREELAVDKEDTDLRDLFELKLLELNSEVQTPDERDVIDVHVGLTNNSDRNLTIHIDLPIVISKKSRRQVTAIQWKENYFFHGVLVSGATVELACHFLKAQIGVIKPGDRIILRVHVVGMEATVIIDEPLRNPKSNCYIVTYCYGRDTIQCHEMIQFRDQVLMKSAPGRAFIDFYYRHSPELIKIMQKSSLMSDAMKRLSKGFISCVLFAMHRRKI